MRKRSWIEVTLILCGLIVSPGCHLLVRLGEPPPQQQPAEQPTPPSSGPKTPPLPGLVPQEEDPPLPGLKTDDRGAAVPRSRPDLYSAGRRINGNTGINTNTAIAPGEGQYVYRTQLRFLESHSSPGVVDIDVNVLVNPHVLAYGVRENFTLFGVVPLIIREGTSRPPAGGFSNLDDQAVADMRFFGKYRFYEMDQPGETTRWSVFGGVEVPTYDKVFSSNSFDPFIGTVWTYQSLDWGLDLDWFWNFNTGKALDEKIWQLNSVFEFNGSYFTDGSNLLYAAPGFQLALESMIVEVSLQLPIIRDLKSTVEPDFVIVIGTRITW